MNGHVESREEQRLERNYAMSTIRIGVTGHRIITDVEPIWRGAEEAMNRIQSAYPGQSLTVLSSLAKGADRIVVEAILQRSDAQLTIVVPIEESVFLGNFGIEGSTSRIHYGALLRRAVEVIHLPDCQSQEESYRRGKEYIADHCDVLIAVWDGRSDQDIDGTSAIVERVLGQGKPVVEVRAGNRKPGTQESTSLGSAQGQVIMKGLP